MFYRFLLLSKDKSHLWVSQNKTPSIHSSFVVAYHIAQDSLKQSSAYPDPLHELH
jgi:hypothetical protein